MRSWFGFLPLQPPGCSPAEIDSSQLSPLRLVVCLMVSGHFSTQTCSSRFGSSSWLKTLLVFAECARFCCVCCAFCKFCFCKETQERVSEEKQHNMRPRTLPLTCTAPPKSPQKWSGWRHQGGKQPQLWRHCTPFRQPICGAKVGELRCASVLAHFLFWLCPNCG